MAFSKSAVVAVVIAALIAILSFPTAKAQEELECRGKDLNMTVTQKSQITDCLKEAGIVSLWKIPMEKLACFGVCVLEKKGMLTPDGKLNHDYILDYIYHVMQPEEVKKPLVDGTEKCIREHGEKVRQPNDPDCLSFMETGQCVHDVFLEICVQ